MNLNAGQDPSLHRSQESPCFDNSTQWMGLRSADGAEASGAVALAALAAMDQEAAHQPLVPKHVW